MAGVGIFLAGCDKFKIIPDGGACEYVNLVEEYRIDTSSSINNTSSNIRFVNTERSEIVRDLNRNLIKSSIPELNDNLIQDTSQIYIISIDIITRGSCTPEIITNLELKAK